MKPGLLTSGRGSFGPPLCRPELIAVRKVRSASDVPKCYVGSTHLYVTWSPPRYYKTQERATISRGTKTLKGIRTMMLEAHAEMPVHPALAVVVALALEVVVVVALAVDEEDDDVTGALDPVSAALTAWSYLPFATTVTSARYNGDRIADDVP